MNSKLETLIEKNSSKFDSWIEIINAHNDFRHSDKKINTEEGYDVITDAADVLAEISEVFFQYGSFKDKFDNSKIHLNFYGPNLIIKSTKTKTEYNLGIDQKGIYLSTSIRNVENLKNMDDGFWSELLKLAQYGNFELLETSGFNIETKRKHPELYHTYKGTIFRIFRKYFVDIYEGREDAEIGYLQVTWPYEVDFEKLVSEGCEVFKILYRLNYSLWKINDLKKEPVAKKILND